MCRIRARELPPVPASVPASRRWTTDLLTRWDLAEANDVAALLTTELVTNAVVHARSFLVVTVAIAQGILEIGVADNRPDEPRIVLLPAPQSARIPRLFPSEGNVEWLASGGRGLRLVDTLAAECGVAQLGVGKQVWFRLMVALSWPHRAACPCGGADPAQNRLHSGRLAVSLAGPWDEDF